MAWGWGRRTSAAPLGKARSPLKCVPTHQKQLPSRLLLHPCIRVCFGGHRLLHIRRDYPQAGGDQGDVSRTEEPPPLAQGGEGGRGPVNGSSAWLIQQPTKRGQSSVERPRTHSRCFLRSPPS